MFGFIVVANIFLLIKEDRIKKLLTINSSCSFLYSIYFSKFLSANETSVISFFSKINDNVYNVNNSLLYAKILFIISLCLIYFFIILTIKRKKGLKPNCFDFLLNLLACLSGLSTSNNIAFVLFIIYILVLAFYLNVNFSYSRRK